MNPELLEKCPQLAEVIESLQERFAGNYQFTSIAKKSTFAEGMAELGKHIAVNSNSANIAVSIGANGVVSVHVECQPTPLSN